MENILVSSLNDVKDIEDLLNKNLPTYRQAYSDRTSWLMACIAELSYIKFNPMFKSSTKDYFLKKVSELQEEKNLKSLNLLIDAVGYDEQEETKKLKENASFLKTKLVKTFDHNGTQAILLENDNYIFLGFRGTEATSIKDINADLKAITTACETGGKIHSGFSDAFNQAYMEIQTTLNEDAFKNKPLFITGHSLGGALATVATKKLTHRGGIAACYTFGSPRVGDDEWTATIKTPIYRLVNAADPVPMLPPGSEVIGVSSWVLGFVPYFGASIRKTLLSKFGGYLHTGDMRYLTNCPNKSYESVKLLYAVSLLFRTKAFFKKKTSFAKIPGDHSISTYRKKLKIIASKKNHVNVGA